MPRKRITQIFPWILPLRRKQRLFCFYSEMKFDHNKYASYLSDELLPYKVFSSACPMRNSMTGFDMVYQENKVHNLMLAAKTMDGLIIKPGETLSFWYLCRHADKDEPYKDALAEIDGKLTTVYGGGLCQISNLLCWVFLHSPLTLSERNGHRKKHFPEPPSDAPLGVDATVAEGWLDFKVINQTDNEFELTLKFDKENIIGALYSDSFLNMTYRVENRKLAYLNENGRIFEEVDVVRLVYDGFSNLVKEEKIYRNRCEVAYPLPEGTVVYRKDIKK